MTPRADGAPEALSRELGAEQAVAGVDARSAVGEVPFGDHRRLKPVPMVERLGQSRRSIGGFLDSLDV